MPGRLGIDFGTSNTVVAVWDETRREGVPLHVPDYGREIHDRHRDNPGEQISVVPSLIHYAPDNRRWLGKRAEPRPLSRIAHALLKKEPHFISKRQLFNHLGI